MNSRIAISLFFLTVSAFSQENCDPEIATNETIEIIENLQIPNCNQKKITNLYNAGNTSPLCDTCRTDARKASTVLGLPTDPASQVDVKNSFIDEFKKSMASNLLEIAKLRALNIVSGDYTVAIEACDLDKFEKGLNERGCKTDGTIADLKTSLNAELARILSPKPIFDDLGLYDRKRDGESCSTPDYKIIQAMSKTLESELSPDLINALASIDPSEPIEESLSEKINKPELLTLLRTHPIISSLMGRPEEFVKFFHRIPTPKSVTQLRESLYDSKNTKILESVANNCSSTFDSFSKAACSPDFQAGKASLENVEDIRPFVGSFSPNRKLFINGSDDEQRQDNKRVLSICEFIPRKNALNLSPLLRSFQKGMPLEYASMPFKLVRSNKYSEEIGSFRDKVCEVGTSCDSKEIFCKIQIEMNKAENLQLSESSNSEINRLLKSFIGTSSKIDTNTKTILISRGIIPDSSGKLVEQPRRPERSRNLAAIENGNSVQTLQPAQQTLPQRTAAAFSAPHQPRNTASASPTQQTTQNVSQTDSPNLDSLSRSISDSREQLAKINENILNRLSKPNAPQAVSREDFRQMTREAYKEQNRPLPAAEEDQFVNNYFPQQQLGQATQFTQGRQAQFEKPTSPEQLKRNLREKQRNEALAKFAAVRDGQSSGAADEAAPQRGLASEKTGSSSSADIAINLPEGSTRLSEVITPQLPDIKKMMAKGEDFTFKIHQSSNDSVFKIIKHGPNKFDVVFLSGDEKKASLYRTELQNILDNLAVRASREALRNALTTP